VVWPGVTAVYCPRAESAAEIQAVARRIDDLERLRGIRPGTIGVTPLIESPQGVSMARAIAASSGRIRAFGVGPNLSIGLGVEPHLSIGLGGEPDTDGLRYAKGECELHARAVGLNPVDTEYILD
jgi:citrate lyase subunit beta/citryl-CoA lyase